MTDTDHTDGSVDGEALTERFSPPIEAIAPYPEAEPPAEPARSSRGLVITASVLALCTVAAAIALFLLAGDDTETADPALADTSTTTEATTTAAPTTTTEATTTTAAPAPPPTAAPARDVLSEPSGQFCRDLNTKGYNYAEAVTYWEHHGRPSQMDASGTGIPCQTVYAHSEVEARWGAAALSPPCPSSAALDNAFWASGVADYIEFGRGLTDIICAGGWVRATTQPDYADAAAVYFRIDGGGPTAIIGGTGIDCVAEGIPDRIC